MKKWQTHISMQSLNNDIQCILAGTSGSFKQEFKHFHSLYTFNTAIYTIQA
jgi:hypothetical protein